MADIFLFKPKRELSAEKNLAEFIAKCRDDLTVFGNDLPWDSMVWPGVTVFAKLGVRTRKPNQGQWLDAEYLDFAKAYFRYQQGHRPTGAKNESKALRAVEASLIQGAGVASIGRLSIAILDEAVVLASNYYSPGAAYHCGREIERLATFVTANNLVPADLAGWRNPIPRADDGDRTGREAREARDKKLPSVDALNAMAEIFSSNPADDRDIFITSVFAMLMCAPSRISEILALPVDCEVVETDRDGVERYGWRFFSGKGYEGDIKWIPSTMVPIAKEAVARLTNLSLNARRFAKWIEENPGRFFRHSNCPRVDEDAPLTAFDVSRALGLASHSAASIRSSLSSRGLSSKNGVYSLSTLQQHVLGRLPPDFPWFDKIRKIRYCDALCVLNENQLHGVKGTLPIELQKPTANSFNADLTPDKYSNSDSGSIRTLFRRYGYKSESGEDIKLTSHQARHLLNTIAQRGGLSNLELAKWSGRADVRQNRVYNHMAEYELVALAERIDPDRSLFGPAGEVPKNRPVSSLEFKALETAAVHVTEYGYCVHDYVMSPCERYRDCLNCTEHVCIKGNAESSARIKRRLEMVEMLYKKAEAALEHGENHSDRWFQYHQKSVTRLRELAAILESPEFEDGAQIKLRGNDFSQLRRVITKMPIESVENHGQESSCLDDLTKTQGGGIG